MADIDDNSHRGPSKKAVRGGSPRLHYKILRPLRGVCTCKEDQVCLACMRRGFKHPNPDTRDPYIDLSELWTSLGHALALPYSGRVEKLNDALVKAFGSAQKGQGVIISLRNAMRAAVKGK